MKNLKLVPLIPFFAVIILFSSCSGITVETNENFEQVEFPDGSVAYLNHNSSLSYDEDFEPRNVELSGEAFFSVTKGETPFVVKTEFGEIQVVGTEFNVKSDKEGLELEVESGVVELKTKQSSKKVKRKQSATFKKTGNGIKIGKAQFKFKIWIKNLKIEFKVMGKKIKHSKHNSKQFKKESGKNKKEFKKAGKDIKKIFKKPNKNKKNKKN